MAVLAAVAVLLGYNYFYRPFYHEPEVAVPSLPSPPPPPAQQYIYENLTPELKITQLLAVPVEVEGGEVASSSTAWIGQAQPGFVTLFGSQISTVSAQAVIAELTAQPTYPELPRFVVVDHEGGTTQRLSGTGFTRLPSWQSLCAQPASESAQLLQASARELADVGVDVVLAPVIDASASNRILNTRICSGNTEVVLEQASRYLAAMRSASILPVLKHFPGLGQTTLDLHRSFDQIAVNPDETGLYPRLLDNYPGTAVMTSHVGVINQYPDVPCSLSQACVGQLTTNYPNSLIFSDALEMVAAGHMANSEELKPLPDRVAEAVTAGNDVLIFGPSVTVADLDAVIAQLANRYQHDSDFAAAVDARLQKVEQYKRLGL